MPHDVTLITTIAAGLGLALVMGYLATRIGVPPLVGYLVAGIIAGPATPGSWRTSTSPASWPSWA
jgi:CPA2 family monovalent cation:H+ antiporter-2